MCPVVHLMPPTTTTTTKYASRSWNKSIWLHFFQCVCVFLHSIIIIINMWCPIYSKNDLFLLPSSSLSSPLSLSFFRTVCLFVYLFKLIFNAAGHFLLLLLFTSFLAAFRFIHLFGPSGCVCVFVLRCVEYDDYDDDHHHSWWWTIRQM